MISRVNTFGGNNSMIVFKDISDALEVEKLTHTKRLTSTITHELRTPANSINGMLQLMKPAIPESLFTYLNVAEISTNMLINLINDYLDFYKFSIRKINTTKSKI